ncbi:MAG: hypothetical protein IKR73_03615 [Oscillospiraceae bacterium]|nr:hypothetical protein [Oscillospiraceae bacterium]
MDDAMKMQTARNVFETICGMLREQDYKFRADPEELKVNFGVRGESFPIDVVYRVIPDRQLVQITSALAYYIPEDKRDEAAIALTMINWRLLNGSFDFDMSDGYVQFRICEAYHDSLIGGEVFDYMTHALFYTVDEYNELLFMLGKGMITLDQLIEKIKE